MREPDEFGYVRTPEQRERMAAARRGTKASDETRAAISAGLTGRTLSELHRRSLSRVLSGRAVPDDVRQRQVETLLANRWTCDECPMTTGPGPLVGHQKSSRHSGRHRPAEVPS